MNKTMDLSKPMPIEFIKKIKCIVALKGYPVDPLSSEDKYYDALNMACEYGQTDLAKFLLEQNCRVNKSADSVVFEKTPLHYAVKNGDIEIIRILLTNHASIVASDTEGNTPLHLAFVQSQEDVIDLITTVIEKTSNYINVKNNQGLTHLHIVCTRKNIRVINGFLKAGASTQDSVNCDSTVWANFTALHFAVEFKSLEAITFLRKRNRIDVINSNEFTPLDLANQQLNEMALIVQQLTKKKNDDLTDTCKQLSYFHLVCMKDNPILLENLIQNGASVNDTINENSVICALYRPLHFAVENNCLKNIEVLLKHGAEVGHQNDQGMTPLHLAFYKRDQSKERANMVSILYAAIKNVVEDNRADDNGLSYFQIAVAQNDLETVKKFLNKHESVNWSIYSNRRNFTKFTPLHFATLYGHENMAQLVIERGAYVNANDEADYGTPLHIAIELANVDLVELLLKNGALVKLPCRKTGKTALHLLVDAYKRLAKEGSTDNKLERLSMYFERLVKLGCDVDAKDLNEDTALHLACSDNFRYSASCAKKLLELGADINSKNCWKSTPFSECLFSEMDDEERGKLADYMLLYEHIQKLKDLGWTVDPKNVECCDALLTRLKFEWGWEDAEEFKDESLANKLQQRLNEVEKMKDVKLTNYLSLYDFMQYDAKRAAVHVKNMTLKELLENVDLMRQLYPEFGYLLRLQYKEAAESIKIV